MDFRFFVWWHHHKLNLLIQLFFFPKEFLKYPFISMCLPPEEATFFQFYTVRVLKAGILVLLTFVCALVPKAVFRVNVCWIHWSVLQFDLGPPASKSHALLTLLHPKGDDVGWGCFSPVFFIYQRQYFLRKQILHIHSYYRLAQNTKYILLIQNLHPSLCFYRELKSNNW